MTNRRSSIHLWIGLLLVFLIVDAGVATWLLRPPLVRSYVVQPSETLADIADRFKVHEETIVQENSLRPGSPVQPGQVLWIPMAPLGPFQQWRLQAVGLAGTVAGALIGLWLSSLGGLLPMGINVQIVSASLAVAIIQYVVVQVGGSTLPAGITPLFILSSVVDGFAWSTVLLLLSKALGFAQQPT